MSKCKRITALFAVFAMVFTMAFSVLFVVHEAEHECSGVDCHICQQFTSCLHLFDNTTPKPETSALKLSVIFSAILLIGCTSWTAINKTLINLKVKLSN